MKDFPSKELQKILYGMLFLFLHYQYVVLVALVVSHLLCLVYGIMNISQPICHKPVIYMLEKVGKISAPPEIPGSKLCPP